jgi:mannitol/fructose-specific phosphotransferase system IIA component (Ntr-type)
LDIQEQAVCLFEPDIDKREALSRLAHAMAATGAVQDAEGFLKAVFDRESVMSTGIGDGVAIPHVRIPEVQEPVIGVGISRDGLNFDTLDDKPVYVLILFALPAGSQKQYLNLLAQVMMVMKEPQFREGLLACASPREIADYVNGR